MWITRNARRWAGLVACLACAVAYPGTALSQQEQDERSDQRNQNQSQTQEEWERGRQDSQDERQARQQADRDQWDQGQRQQEQRARDRQWSDRGEFPPPRDPWSEESYRREVRSWRDEQGTQGRQGGLGVTLGETGREQREGITVLRVHAGSPAEQMGLREGDRIMQLNGQRVQSAQQFVSDIKDMRPGEEIELEVRRDSQQRSLSGELESRQEALVLSNRQIGGRQRGDQWQWDRAEYRDSDQYQARTGYRGRAGYQDRFDERGSYATRDGSLATQVNQLQREVDRLSRELAQLRSTIRGREGQARQSRFDRGETTASYQEYDSERGQYDREQPGRWDDQGYERDRGGYQEYRANYGGTEGEQAFDSDSSVETPGGETGAARTRIGAQEE